MGVQAALVGDLVRPEASTDREPPEIVAAHWRQGTWVVKASDRGGAVAALEWSDGSASPQPARSSSTYASPDTGYGLDLGPKEAFEALSRPFVGPK